MSTFTERVLVSAYSLAQQALKNEGLVDEFGIVKKKKRLDLDEEQSIFIYKWLTEKLRHLPETEFQEIMQEYRDVVLSLTDDYTINELYTSLALVDTWLIEHGTKRDNILISNKIRMLMETIRKVLTEKKGEEYIKKVSRDSTLVASNIYRIMNGEPELTKAEREARINRWKHSGKED